MRNWHPEDFHAVAADDFRDLEIWLDRETLPAHQMKNGCFLDLKAHAQSVKELRRRCYTRPSSHGIDAKILLRECRKIRRGSISYPDEYRCSKDRPSNGWLDGLINLDDDEPELRAAIFMAAIL